MSQIVIELMIGNPPKKLNCSLNLISFHSLFLSHKISGIELNNFYNKTQSSTYNNIEEKNIYFGEDFDRAEIFSDNIQIYSNDNNKILDNKFIFLLIDDIAYNVPNEFYAPGLIGLRLNSETDKLKINEHRFIYQIKKYGLADTETFFFDFNKNDENGYFVLGEDLFNNENYLHINAGSMKMSTFMTLEWSFNFDNVYYGNQEIKFVTNALIKTENGLIVGPTRYEYIINEYFKNETKCYLNNTKMGYATFKYYYCEEDFDENKMEDLIFVLKSIKFNFTLTGKDLFYTENGKKYFKVLFLYSYDQQYWYIGREFLKKYKLRFDTDRKLIYIPLKDEIIDKNISENSISIFKQAYFWIILGLSLFIICLILFIVIYLKKYPRKKRANELDDDFEYNKKKDIDKNIN